MIELDPSKWELAPLTAPVPPFLPEALGYAPKCPARYLAFWYEGFSDGSWTVGGAGADAHVYLAWWRHPAVSRSAVRHLHLGDDEEPMPYAMIVVDLAGKTDAGGLPAWWGQAECVEGFLRQQHPHLTPPTSDWTPPEPTSQEELMAMAHMGLESVKRPTSEELAEAMARRAGWVKQVLAWLDASAEMRVWGMVDRVRARTKGWRE